MKGRIFFGIIVVVVGVLLLLMALDLIPLDGIGELLLYIPSLFILWGLYLLVTQKFKRAAGPIVMIAIATVVQLMLLDVLRWAYVWPIAIILIGVAIIAGGAGYHGRRRRRRERRRNRKHRHAQAESRTSAEGDLDISVTMSEANERNRSREFKGGDITCVMGTVKLDLTEAEIAEPPARIHVDIVMGGLDDTRARPLDRPKRCRKDHGRGRRQHSEPPERGNGQWRHAHHQRLRRHGPCDHPVRITRSRPTDRT